MASMTRAFFATTIVLSFAIVVDTSAATDAVPDISKKEEAVSPTMTKNLGVLLNDSRAFPGYNLINPSGKSTYLYDNEGRVVHSWTSEYSGGVAYLSTTATCSGRPRPPIATPASTPSRIGSTPCNTVTDLIRRFGAPWQIFRPTPPIHDPRSWWMRTRSRIVSIG